MCLLYVCLSFAFALWLGHFLTKKAQAMAKKRALKEAEEEYNDRFKNLSHIKWNENGEHYITDLAGNKITKRK